jgi:hypothetical protein
MDRKRFLFPVAFMAILVVATVVAAAPPTPPYAGIGKVCAPGISSYKVVHGDSLAGKAGDDKWKAALDKLTGFNDWIGKRLEPPNANGVEVLWIMPDEVICGMRESGVMVVNTTTNTVAPKPAEKTGLAIIAGGVTNVSDVDTDYTWLWWLLAILALALLLRRLVRGRREREREAARLAEEDRLAAQRQREEEDRQREAERQRRLSDPVTAGPPMREGGIANLPPAEITSYLDQLANANHTNGRGGRLLVRMGPAMEGNLLGAWRISFAGAPAQVFDCDGSDKYRAYQSVYRNTNTGGIVVKYGFQSCGNDAEQENAQGEGGWFIPKRTVVVPTPPPVFGLQQAMSLTRRLDAGTVTETDRPALVFSAVLDVLGVENTIEAEARAAAESIAAHRAEQLAQAERLRHELALIEAGAQEDDQSIIDLVELGGRFGLALPDPRQATLELADGDPAIELTDGEPVIELVREPETTTPDSPNQ